MENPYLALGMKSRISRTEIVKELEDRIRFLSRLKADNEYFFKKMIKDKNMFKYVGKKSDFSDIGIEEELSQKFACNIIPKSRFLSYRELSRLKGTVKLEGNSDNPEIKDNYSFYVRVVKSQQQRLNAELEKYNEILDNYRNNHNSEEARTALYDLYIKMKYEDEVVKLAADIAMKTPRTFNAKKDRAEFKLRLTRDPRFLKLKGTYAKVATTRKRDDLNPELYVKARLGNPDLLTIADPDWKKYIIGRERKFCEQYLHRISQNNSQEKNDSNEAVNQEHDYGWAMIIDNPEVVMDGVEVNTSDFEGKVTVKHMGYFSSESLFRKKKVLKEKHETTKISKAVIVDKEKRRRFTLREHIPDPNIPENMREYYYKYDPTKQSFNNVYLVSKTDNDGKTQEYIAFSPIKKGEFGEKYPESFMANVYFSNYALSVAQQNGGFAGSIEKDKNGLSISTAYNQEEIASAVLYQSGSTGKIIDRTKSGKTRWEDINGKAVDNILRGKGEEREISLDE